MKIEDLERELEADLANKLAYPKTVLSHIRSKEAKRAVRYIDEAMTLVRKWFEKMKTSAGGE